MQGCPRPLWINDEYCIFPPISAKFINFTLVQQKLEIFSPIFFQFTDTSFCFPFFDHNAPVVNQVPNYVCLGCVTNCFLTVFVLL